MRKRFIAFAAAALSALGAFADIKAVRAVPRDGGKPTKATMKRHAKKAEAAKNGGGALVFIGDSITHFWESKGAKVLRRNFAKGEWKMFNLGTSGDRTEHVIWRLENGELDGFSAKCVHVMIGTNNTGQRKFADEPPSDTILGIRRILQIVREKQPQAKIILTAIFPRGEKATDARRLRNDVVNAEISKLCDGQTILWCDFRDRFLEDDGTLPAETVPGFLHPNAKGYQIWADAVRPYVAHCLTGKGPAPVSPPAKDPRPGCEPDGHPRAARPTTRIRPLAERGGWAEKLLRDRNRIVEKKSFDLVLLGDGTLAGRGKDCAGEVLDLAYPGDRTEHVLWRAMYGELEGYKAKRFVVAAGTENLDDSPEDIAAGVARILETVAKKHPKTKVTLVPVAPKGPEDHRRAAGVNALLKRVAEERGVSFGDAPDARPPQAQRR